MNQYIDHNSNNIDLILEQKFRGDDHDRYTYEEDEINEEFDWNLYQYLVGKMND